MEGQDLPPNGCYISAYLFNGNCDFKAIDVASFRNTTLAWSEFRWLHIDLSRSNCDRFIVAKFLFNSLSSYLKLENILSLVSDGPFCGEVNNCFDFRLNSPTPPTSKYTFRLAVHFMENIVITVSLEQVKRLSFDRADRESLLHKIQERNNAISDHEFKFLLTSNHSDKHVPRNCYGLVMHFIDSHLDYAQDLVTELEIRINSAELNLDKGSTTLKKEMINHRIIPKMHLDLQYLLQFVAHGEQVFPRVKKKWDNELLMSPEMSDLEELIGRLTRLKENLGFMVNRVTTIQTGLDSWQAEQINNKLYYFSLASVIFLPLSIVTGVFGMNVGGIPWIGQKDPELKHGFRNVLLLSTAMVLFLLFCFTYPTIRRRITAWRGQGRI